MTIEIGQRVALLVDIWDDGQDHHPPGYPAQKGEILVVRKLEPGHVFPILASHEGRTDDCYIRLAEAEVE